MLTAIRALRTFLVLAPLFLAGAAGAEPTLVITPPEDPCRHISDLAKGESASVGGVSLSMETFSYAACEYAREQVEASIRARLEALRSGAEERGKAELDKIYERFLAWLASQVREVVYNQLPPEQRAALSPEDHFKDWLKNPDQALSDYVDYYFATHYPEFQANLERYRNDNSTEIIEGLKELWAKAKDRLDKLTSAVRDLEAEPDAGPERVADILNKYGLSGEWVSRFRQYEGRFNQLDASYGIVDTARMVHAAFTAEDYSGKLTGMFALMEKFGGYLSDSNVPGVSLIGTLIEAYGQLAKEALARANELEKLIRQREGHCIGLAAHTLLEKRSQSLKSQFGDDIQACPLDEKRPFLRDIYVQSIPQDNNQLYFWDGAKFIKGRPAGGGQSGVDAAQRFIRDAAAIGLVEYVGKDLDMATIAAVYNTPYGPEHYLKGLPGHSPKPGLAGIISEGQAVIEAITDRVRALKSGARLDNQCGEQDFAAFLDRETSLRLSQYPLDTPEYQERLAFSYTLGFVQTHSTLPGATGSRGAIYDRYKRIWEQLEDLSLLVLFGHVVDKRDRTKACEDCAGARISLSVSGGSEWSACGVTSADDTGGFVARIGTRTADISISASASAVGVTSETLTIDKRALGLSAADVPFVREFAFNIALPLEGDEDAAQASLDALRGHHSAASKAFSAAQAACGAAKAVIADAAAKTSEIAGRADQIAERIAKISPRRREFDRLRQRLEAAKTSAEKAAEAVVEAKQKGEGAALSACDLTATLRKEDDEAVQRRMLTEVRGHALSARTYARASDRALTAATRAASQAEELASSAVEIAEAIERLDADIKTLLADAEGLETGLAGLDGHKVTLTTNLDSLREIEPLALAAFNAVKGEASDNPDMLAEAERLYGAIEGFPGQVEGCADEVEEAASDYSEAMTALQGVLDGISTPAGGAGAGADAQLLASQGEDARASADIAEVFVEAARAAATDADRCLKLAEAALTGGPSDDLSAAAEAAIAKCDFKSAYALLKRMTGSPSYSGLAASYRAAFAREKQTKAFYDQAKAAHAAGRNEEALRLLLSARTNTKCSNYQIRINEAIAAIRGAGDDSLLAEARAAIGACDFETARTKVAELGRLGHPSFAEVQADLKAAANREKRTDALFQQARSRRDEGKTEAAIALLQEALANTGCDDNRSRINAALAGLSSVAATPPADDEPSGPAVGAANWQSAFRGEVRLTRVIVNGSESSPLGLIQSIDREWRRQRNDRTKRNGVIPAIGDSLYDIITGVVVTVIGTLADGIPLSFTLVPEGSAYRIWLVGDGEKATPERLKQVPAFQPVDARTLRMTWQSETGEGRITVTLTANEAFDAITLDLQGSGRATGDDTDDFYGIKSVSLTVSGTFQEGSIPARQLEATVEQKAKAAARRYAPYLKVD